MGANGHDVDRTLTIPDTPHSPQRESDALECPYLAMVTLGGRRTMVARKTWLAFLASLAMLVTMAAQAIGGEKWCEEEPVVKIDGLTVDYPASFKYSYVNC